MCCFVLFCIVFNTAVVFTGVAVASHYDSGTNAHSPRVRVQLYVYWCGSMLSSWDNDSSDGRFLEPWTPFFYARKPAGGVFVFVFVFVLVLVFVVVFVFVRPLCSLTLFYASFATLPFAKASTSLRVST